jgi:hypothetical protein
MLQIIAAFGSGLIFGAGLMISGMTDPLRVLGFLDVFGRWDPTLAFVMIAALVVTMPGFALARYLGKPVLAAQNLWPTRTVIDRRLVFGAVLFGIGWGLVGLCPGPSLVNLATFSPPVIVFVAAMAVAMVLHDRLRKRLPD